MQLLFASFNGKVLVRTRRWKRKDIYSHINLTGKWLQRGIKQKTFACNLISKPLMSNSILFSTKQWLLYFLLTYYLYLDTISNSSQPVVMFNVLRHILALAVMLGALNLSAQTIDKNKMLPKDVVQVQPAVTDDSHEIVDNYNGTYRFIFTKGIKQAFTDDIINTIELSRKDDEDVIVVLSPYTKLQILSRKKIASEGFVPFNKSYVFENGSN